MFGEVKPLVTSCMDGYNVCIFAYGQTGSGKTFTMEVTFHILVNINVTVPYSRKLSREKTCRISRFCSYSSKFSQWNWGVWCLFPATPVSNPQKVSPQKSYFSPIHESFLPRKFPLYGSNYVIVQGVFLVVLWTNWMCPTLACCVS